MLTITYAMMLIVCAIIMKGHKLGEARLLELIVSQCISLIMAAVILYFPMSLLQYELLDPTPLVLLVLGQWALTALWCYVANKMYFRVVPPLRLLFITDGRRIPVAVEKIANIPERYKVCQSANISEGKSAIREKLHDCDGVLFFVKDAEWRSWTVRLCFKRNLKMIMVPTLTDVIVNRAQPMHLIDTPLFCSTAHCLSLEERALKRTMDILGSLVAIILFSPFMLIAALCVKLQDGGPILFRQERLTRNGKVFRICKFRTMVVDAEKHGQKLATEHDERITKVGRVLRKLRIDEFPQLFNVLAGDMSLVGPRPECPAIAEEYEKKLPEFAYRLKVKAGITGYAQVYGDYSTNPADKLMMDAMYIESYNILLDINLILLTVRTLFITDKTKGKTEEQAEAESAKV